MSTLDTTQRPWLARLHPSLFAMPLGLIGLAGAWRRAVLLGFTFGQPVSLWLFGAGVVLFGVLLLLWLAKLALHPAAVRQEWVHPVQGPMLAMMPVTVLLIVAHAAQALPLSFTFWLVLTLGAFSMQGVLAWQVVARLSTGKMPPELVTPTLYLPTVAGGLVGSMALSALDLAGWAALLFGMGVGAWALLEVRILNRLFAGPLPVALRSTLGIEIAPAAAGSLAVATLWPALPAEVLMVCLGVASGPVLAVLTRWQYWSAAPFSAGFWSFSFPLAALAGAMAEAVQRGNWPPQVALVAVLVASAVIAFLAVRTMVLLGQGKLLPPQ